MAKRKIAEKDFLESDLPQTRRSQLFSMLKINWLTFFTLGLILFGSLILLIAKNFVVDYFNALTLNAVKLGNMEKAEGDYWIRIIFLISNGADIVLYPLIFVILAGVLRVIRQLFYSEGLLFKYHFKKGVKNNWKQFVFAGLLTATIKLGCNALITFYGSNGYTIAVVVFFAVIIVPLIVIYLYYSTIYTSNFFISFRNSLYIYVKSNWQTLLFVIVTFGGIVSLEFFFNFPYVKQIIYIVLAIFVLPIDIAVGFAIYLNQFDKTINIVDFPELIRMGLYVPNHEKEMLIDKRIKILIKKGYEDLSVIKNMARQFQIKGTDMTSFKENDLEKEMYYVEFDQKYKYIIYLINDIELDKSFIDRFCEEKDYDLIETLTKDNKNTYQLNDKEYGMYFLKRK